MTAETVLFNKTSYFAELYEDHSCEFFLSASGATQGFVEEQPRSFAVVVTQSHPQKAPGKEKGKQGLAGGGGQCLGHSWHGDIRPKLSTL